MSSSRTFSDAIVIAPGRLRQRRTAALVLLALALLLALLLVRCAATTGGDSPQAEYDSLDGRLRQLTFDANRNGHNDAVATINRGRIESIALDYDENNKTDRWDFYNEQRRLEKVGFSRSNNGVMDAVAFFTNDGALDRIELSADDGTDAVAAIARKVAGLDRPGGTDLTAEAVRNELAAAAARAGIRWVVPIPTPVRPSP